jgi:hypothetical protein
MDETKIWDKKAAAAAATAGNTDPQKQRNV